MNKTLDFCMANFLKWPRWHVLWAHNPSKWAHNLSKWSKHADVIKSRDELYLNNPSYSLKSMTLTRSGRIELVSDYEVTMVGARMSYPSKICSKPRYTVLWRVGLGCWKNFGEIRQRLMLVEFPSPSRLSLTDGYRVPFWWPFRQKLSFSHHNSSLCECS